MPVYLNHDLMSGNIPVLLMDVSCSTNFNESQPCQFMYSSFDPNRNICNNVVLQVHIM